jgi:hypothetical protein
MIFNLFSYCDGFLKAPTLGQNNPIDNLSQQSNTTSEKDNFVPLVQETANVNFELESELNELATNKPFGNTVPQDEWKSDEVGGFFVKGGGLEQKGKTDKAHDIVYKAKRVGYRYTDERAKKLGLSSNAKPTQEHIEKYLGNGVYKEDRANRSDKSRMKKLNRGGSAGNKAIMQKIQDEVRKLKAEAPNMFKKHTDFVKKAASNLKSKGEI